MELKIIMHLNKIKLKMNILPGSNYKIKLITYIFITPNVKYILPNVIYSL